MDMDGAVHALCRKTFAIVLCIKSKYNEYSLGARCKEMVQVWARDIAIVERVLLKKNFVVLVARSYSDVYSVGT